MEKEETLVCLNMYEKKYKEALERASKFYNNEECRVGMTPVDLEVIFPELKESEDEKIRKAIHIYLDWLDGRKDYAPKGEYTIKDMIAWLDEQGEQKGTNGNEKEIPNEQKPTEEYHGEDYGIDGLWHAQRILEKTLGKVNGYQTDDGILSHECAITAVKKLYEQKPVSITDEWIEDYWQHEKVNNPYSYDKGEEIQFDHQGFIRFCKKYCKKPAEWSEEDIRNIENIDSVLFYDKDLPEDTCVRLRNWLESLKPQNHWKPTEAQLASLTIACDRNDRIGFDLTQLLKELKKL